jgi:hypothetical protein
MGKTSLSVRTLAAAHDELGRSRYLLASKTPNSTAPFPAAVSAAKKRLTRLSLPLGETLLSVRHPRCRPGRPRPLETLTGVQDPNPPTSLPAASRRRYETPTARTLLRSKTTDTPPTAVQDTSVTKELEETLLSVRYPRYRS